MRFAMVNGQRQEAQPHLQGACPACGHPVVARCGTVRLWHWAHLGQLVCDSWWEETQWHRDWKALFPVEWQEVVQYAGDGEKHIADVKTGEGFVLEFQHSPLAAQERQARENFYQRMAWVVDGLRRSRDKAQFLRALEAGTIIAPTLWRLRGYWDECTLLREWQGSGVQVIIDLGENDLWFLFPVDGRVYVATFSRPGFIDFHRTGTGAFAHFYSRLAQIVTADLAKLRAMTLLDQQQVRSAAATSFQRYLARRERSRRRF